MGTAGCGRPVDYRPDAGRTSMTKTIHVGGVDRTYLLHSEPRDVFSFDFAVELV